MGRFPTIIDWDKKELVVPNKEFVTGRLLNWTLTDTVNRLIITVGVSYRSDPDKVREVLLQCAADNPLVPQIAIVSPPTPRSYYFLGGLPSFPSRLRDVWSSRR